MKYTKKLMSFLLLIFISTQYMTIPMLTIAADSYSLDVQNNNVFYINLKTFDEDLFKTAGYSAESFFGPGAKEGHFCKYQITRLSEDSEVWTIRFNAWEWASSKEEVDQGEVIGYAELEIKKDPSKNEGAIPETFLEIGLGLIPVKVEDYIKDVDWEYNASISGRKVTCEVEGTLNETAEFNEDGIMTSFEISMGSTTLVLLEFDSRDTATDFTLFIIIGVIAGLVGLISFVIIKKKRSKGEEEEDEELAGKSKKERKELKKNRKKKKKMSAKELEISEKLEHMEEEDYVTFQEEEAIEDEEPTVLENKCPKCGWILSSSAAECPRCKAEELKAKKQAEESSKVNQIEKLNKQIQDIQKQIGQIDNQFSSNQISQEEYMQQKTALYEKIGSLQGRISSLQED